MYKIHIFKRASQEIIEYFFNQIYDLLASEDPQKVKTHIQKILDLETKHYLQAHISSMNRYTFYASVGKPDTEGYHVAINSLGRASCSCPSYYHRHHRKSGYCKHIIALALVLEKPPRAKEIAVQLMEM
jgi:predicted nucleic acid-binding Zn finger protein